MDTIITISSVAAASLRMLIEQEPDAPELGIQVQMTSTGCGSLSFSIGITTPNRNDLCEEVEGIRVFYTQNDRSWLQGLVIDRNAETGKFEIFHPNPPSTSCPI
ncbi:hypothetical protein [Brevibacillus sp. SYSU BS000544]|uniref:hypothetical protein n=1 Tax=Brevibacillus sp. SYSU BS000544 TaxID=3416443 RepID=UPI003CE52E23